MPERTVKAVETWDLSEMLAVLCQIARDAIDAESTSRAAEVQRIPFEGPLTEQGGSRT